MSTAAPPWGTTRMGPFVESGPVPALTSVIDPETQVAVYYDDKGRKLEMGAHGTSTNTSTPTTTGGGGGDGQSGGQAQPSDIDSMPANDQDQGTG
ncbi:putative ATP-grasp target RiPP [Kitasatospora sp. MAA4]|uniref:putative ATP-grasp-modified RiPP n=1 Tax=Kitasatospora sp. MAA4 TaxID=3035093 RepID=UPI002476A246|nr:putative ATP-grasp-modified RiPP [Kitasatospora sp. MAA4]MDH6134674.1 putative ATP-grasp target RiPP [Kitasatospora sp. MAA4]